MENESENRQCEMRETTTNPKLPTCDPAPPQTTQNTQTPVA